MLNRVLYSLFGVLALSLLSTTGGNAQSWDGSGISTTTSGSSPKVGIGTISPDANLTIIGGYTLSGGGWGSPPPPCAATGAPALHIVWSEPLTPPVNCPNSYSVPHIVDIHTAAVPGLFPASPLMVLNSGGLGLKTLPVSNYALAVNGNSYLGNTQVKNKLRVNSSSALSNAAWLHSNFPYSFAVENGDAFFAGKVRIGATEPTNAYAGYQLGVDGDVVCKRLVVEVTDWADYVFENDYKLMPLDALAEYINVNKHLPGVSSAQQVVSEGLNVGEMEVTLMRKVEELTLYILDLEKRIKSLERAK